MQYWDDSEYECPVCGLPFGTDGEPAWMVPVDDEDVPLPADFDDDEGKAWLYKKEEWLAFVTLLCDPDDELGQLVPGLTYQKYDRRHRCDGVSHRGPLPSTLASHASRPRRTDNIVELPAYHSYGSKFRISEPDRHAHREVIVSGGSEGSDRTFDERAYVPLHDTCLVLAERVMKSTGAAHIKNMRSLFLALRWRQAMTYVFRWYGESANYALGCSEWYLPHSRIWERKIFYEQAEDNDPEFYEALNFLIDPLDVEDLTDTLLRNLRRRRRSAPTEDSRKFWTSLKALPEEVLQIVMVHLRSSRDFPRTSNLTLPQTFWMNELMMAGDGILPWLWDIDVDKVISKSKEPCRGGDDFEWNWERLVRKLTRGVDAGIAPDRPEDVKVDISQSYEEDKDGFDICIRTWTGYKDVLKYVPWGLHNRRRIWQLLEEMFVGDKLPGGGTKDLAPVSQQCVELPFTKSGDLRTTAIWLPCIDFRGFVRKLGGRVYQSGEGSLQYWQTREFKAKNGAEDLDRVEEPASPAEIYAVLRQLEYPV